MVINKLNMRQEIEQKLKHDGDFHDVTVSDKEMIRKLRRVVNYMNVSAKVKRLAPIDRIPYSYRMIDKSTMRITRNY